MKPQKERIYLLIRSSSSSSGAHHGGVNNRKRDVPVVVILEMGEFFRFPMLFLHHIHRSTRMADFLVFSA